MVMLNNYMLNLSHITPKALVGDNTSKYLNTKLMTYILTRTGLKHVKLFLNMVDSKLTDHMGIAHDPSQYPDFWYIT